MDTYLDVLGFLKNDIESADMDKFEVHARLEAELIAQIASLQRVIGALDVGDPGTNGSGAFGKRFSRQCERALEKNRENQCLIARELEETKNRLSSMRRFSARTGARYLGAGGRSGKPLYIDITQ